MEPEHRKKIQDENCAEYVQALSGENMVLEYPTSSDTNQPAQLHRHASLQKSLWCSGKATPLAVIILKLEKTRIVRGSDYSAIKGQRYTGA